MKEDLFSELINKVRKRILSWENNFLSAGGKLVLVKSILNTMPIYLFQVLQPPGGVIKKLERMFNAFFWGSTESMRRIHWKSWKKMCYPTEEGGLGIRSLRDMTMAMSMKLWWRFRTQESLWAKTMESKYGRKLPHQIMVAKVTDSHAWKRMCWISREAEEKIVWAVGKGTLSLWYDKWIHGQALITIFPQGNANNDRVDSIMIGQNWMEEEIRRYLPTQVCEQILKVHIGMEDMPFWIGAEGCEFSTKLAWMQVRQRQDISLTYKNIWHNSIPKKVSVFGWRLIQELIPTEMRMKRFNIPIASKCMCCEQEENTNHVFINGELANAVWTHFNRWFSIPLVSYQSASALLMGWASSHDWVMNGHIRISIPLLVLWGIWKARNSAKHKNMKMTATGVIAAVEKKIRLLIDSKLISYKLCRGDQHFKHMQNIRAEHRKVERIMIFSWRKPDLGWCKLNTDGVSKGNPGQAAAGAILRDHEGKVLFAFCCNLGVQTAYLAELMALKEGLQIIKQRNIQKIWIELDSKVIERQLARKHKGNWASYLLWEEIWQILQNLEWCCSHTWREANSAADWLANMGIRVASPVLLQGRPPPGRLRGITRLDAEGFHAFRICYRGLGK